MYRLIIKIYCNFFIVDIIFFIMLSKYYIRLYNWVFYNDIELDYGFDIKKLLYRYN